MARITMSSEAEAMIRDAAKEEVKEEHKNMTKEQLLEELSNRKIKMSVLNMQIPASMHEQLRLLAKERNEPVARVIREALFQYMKAEGVFE